MFIRLTLDIDVPSQHITELFAFLEQQHLAPGGTVLVVHGAYAHLAPESGRFPRGEAAGACRLEVHFLNQDRSRTEALLSRSRIPKLLIGPSGPPTTLNHVCVPFVGNRYRARWLMRVLDQAVRHHWKVRILHGEKSLFVREILKLADWFKEPQIKEAVRDWLDTEARRAMRKFVEAHPETEIRSGAGGLAKLLTGEDPKATMILGNPAVVHLLKRHHGVSYGALLTKSGLSGYFTGRKPRR